MFLLLTCFTGGNGSQGQLGQGGDADTVLVPTALRSFTNRPVRSLSSGFRHSALVADNGACYTFGSNDDGALGHTKRRTRPETVDSLEAFSIEQIAAGGRHTVALTKDGMVFTWGASDRGQLGLGLDAMLNGGDGGSDHKFARPQRVRALDGVSVAQVATGDNHVLALDTSGTVWAWGDNAEGQLGIGTFAASHSPVPVSGLRGVPIVRVACGSVHSLALSAGGDVYAWGSNRFGQIAQGDVPKKLRPTFIEGLEGKCVVDIACGSEHSVVLTSAGRVVSFGAGSNGQLGHGADQHEALPRTIVDLMGTESTLIACGRRHTLVYQEATRRLYAFGLGASGQLGNGRLKSCNAPEAVVLPEGARVTQIFAGGDQSFAVVEAPMEPSEDELVTSTSSIAVDDVLCRARPPTGPHTLNYITPDILAQLLQGRTDRLVAHLSSVFSSAACLNASFFPPAHNGGPFSSADAALPIDLAAVRDAYALLWGHADSAAFVTAIGNATAKLVSSISTESVVVARPDNVRFFLMLLENPLFLAPDRMFAVLAKLVTVLAGLRGEPRATLGRWLGAGGAPYLGRALQLLQNFLSHALKHPDLGLDLAVPNCTAVIAWLHSVNAAHQHPLPVRAFYNPTITTHVDVITDFDNTMRKTNIFTFSSMPFLLEPAVKKLFFEIAVHARMEALAQDAVVAGLQGKEHARPYLELRIRREHIMQDARDQIEQTRQNSDLHKALIVRFQDEEAQDDGGVRKEFFHLLFKGLTDPASGFFSYDPETRLLWFGDGHTGDARSWELIGTYLGLAVQNGCLVDVHLPTVFYSKLLARGDTTFGIEDLAELQPAVHRSLRFILDETDEETIANLGLVFEYDTTVAGEPRAVPLKPNGGDIPVTVHNRAEYVRLVVQHLLVGSVAAMFDPLRKGFLRVCDGPTLRIFDPTEVELLVCGVPTFQFHELEGIAQYGEGYSKDHPTIKLFWQAFHALPTELKRKFLLFVSGSDRVPLGGWKSFRLVIQRTGDPAALPAAHTCFNILDLPEYTSLDELQSKLVYALQNTEGFGLV